MEQGFEKIVKHGICQRLLNNKAPLRQSGKVSFQQRYD